MTNAFAADLYSKLASGTTGNLFFSPFSVEAALAMTYAGAAGDTAVQMARTLQFTLPPEKLNAAFAGLLKELNSPLPSDLIDDSDERITRPAYELVIANALWGQKGYPFNPQFTQLLDSCYGAALKEVDFLKQTEEARRSINDWVAAHTGDKIRNLVPSGILGSLTRLVLTNAIYFKSNWAAKFPKASTSLGPFNLSTGNSVDVPIMRQTRVCPYFEDDHLQILGLTYSRRALSMVILLPRTTDTLAQAEKTLTADQLARWANTATDAKADIFLPRFKITGDAMFSRELMRMGMTDAFDQDKADFSGIASAETLYMYEVIHKAFVAVDEDGTEAAAATAVAMFGRAPPREKPKAVVFKADRPFIFLIRHNASSEILFMGRLMDPRLT